MGWDGLCVLCEQHRGRAEQGSRSSSPSPSNRNWQASSFFPLRTYLILTLDVDVDLWGMGRWKRNIAKFVVIEIWLFSREELWEVNIVSREPNPKKPLHSCSSSIKNMKNANRIHSWRSSLSKEVSGVDSWEGSMFVCPSYILILTYSLLPVHANFSYFIIFPPWL